MVWEDAVHHIKWRQSGRNQRFIRLHPKTARREKRMLTLIWFPPFPLLFSIWSHIQSGSSLPRGFWKGVCLLGNPESRQAGNKEKLSSTHANLRSTLPEFMLTKKVGHQTASGWNWLSGNLYMGFKSCPLTTLPKWKGEELTDGTWSLRIGEDKEVVTNVHRSSACLPIYSLLSLPIACPWIASFKVNQQI